MHCGRMQACHRVAGCQFGLDFRSHKRLMTIECLNQDVCIGRVITPGYHKANLAIEYLAEVLPISLTNLNCINIAGNTNLAGINRRC